VTSDTFLVNWEKKKTVNVIRKFSFVKGPSTDITCLGAQYRYSLPWSPVQI
jgi:hypothetical protein